jgi:hypothetical protein
MNPAQPPDPTADAPAPPPPAETATADLPPRTATLAGSEPAGPPDVPVRVGRYAVRRLLGRGGMGAVYLAHDPELDRPVALKVPRLSDPDAEERFLREARAAAALDHPNLCRVYDAGRSDVGPYLAMAYVPGPTLTEVVRTDGPLPPPAPPRSRSGWPAGWPRPTATGSSTATSSPATSS